MLYDVDTREDKYTKILRAWAIAAGWPVMVSVQLSVVMQKGRYIVDYPTSVQEQVLTLETGTQTVPPNPVIRNFLATIPQREGL